MLSIESISVTIQSVQALRGFSLAVETGSMVGLVGRNGAGKTTLLRTVMGHLSPLSGRITWDGTDLAGVPRHGRAALGIGYMPEDRGLVPELTVEENICLPLWVSKGLAVRERLDFVYGILPELQEMRERKALLLSGGQQRQVAHHRAHGGRLARAVAADQAHQGARPQAQREAAQHFHVLDRDARVLDRDHAVAPSASVEPVT